MTHPLAGCWARLDRANEHLDALKAEIEGQTHRIAVESKLDLDAGKFAVLIADMPDMPIRWGAITGDCIQNFRIALEYLAWELVILDSGKPYPRSQFPIVDLPEHLGRSRNLKTMKRLTPEHRALIEWAQGYSHGYGAYPRGHVLGTLRDISNIDKHKVILGAGLAADETLTARVKVCRDLDLGEWFRYLVAVPLETGAELISTDVAQTGPDPHMEVEHNLPLYVSFGMGGNLTENLDKIGAFVVEIAREFEPFF